MLRPAQFLGKVVATSRVSVCLPLIKMQIYSHEGRALRFLGRQIGECGKKKDFPNLIAVENFHFSNRAVNGIEDDHAWYLRIKWYALMARPPGSTRFGARVDRRAKIVATTAAVHNLQVRNLISEILPSFSHEQLLKLGRQRRKHLGKKITRLRLAHRAAGIRRGWNVSQADRLKWTSTPRTLECGSHM